MGHLINPVSVRLGFSTFWISSWSITNIGSYSYFVLLDNLVVELMSFFFYQSFVVDRLSKFGFFFSHFRLIRRNLGFFCIKLFFVPNSTTILPKTFVELGDRERFKFASLLGFRFLRLSHLIQRWVEKRTGRAKERQSLFRLRRFKFISGERILKLKERFLFSHKVFSWKPQKKKKLRLFGVFDRIWKKVQKRVIRFYRGSFSQKRKYRQQKVYELKRIFVARSRLLKQALSTLRVGSLRFIKLTLRGFSRGFLNKKLQIIPITKKMRKRRFFSYKKRIRALVFAKIKTVRSRLLVAVMFARLRRTNAVSNFFKYLGLLYSELVSVSLQQVSLFQKLNSKAFSTSLSFSLLHRFRILNPQFISRFIAKRLTYGIPLRRVLKPIVIDLTKNILNPTRLLQGFRIKCSGRFNRAQMATVTVERYGRVSLSSIASSVGLGYSTAFLRYGACGIKVWLSSKKYIVNSSLLNFSKFNTLKLLNSVLAISKKYNYIARKPYLYSYFLSSFILNLLPFKLGVTLEDEDSIPEDLALAPGFIGFMFEEDELFEQFHISPAVIANSVLFSFLRFRKCVRKIKRRRFFTLLKGRRLKRRSFKNNFFERRKRRGRSI